MSLRSPLFRLHFLGNRQITTMSVGCRSRLPLHHLATSVVLALLLATSCICGSPTPSAGSPTALSANVAPQLMSKTLLSKHYISCILSDVDGTLLSSAENKHQLSKRTFTTIAAVIDSGYAFFPCTGRSRHSMALAAPEILNLFGGDIENVPGVYQQGLQVYGPTGQLIYEKFLDYSKIAEVTRFCDDEKVAVIAYAGERIFCRTRCNQTDKIGEYSEPPPEIHSDGLEKLGDIGIKVHKLIILADEIELERVRPLLQAYMGQSVSLTKAVPGMLEVLPPGSSKGEGVSVLLKHIGVSPENVMAFGDGENDVEMFSLVQLGVAVENAKTILKNNAQALTLSNDDDGVAEVLELLLESQAEVRARILAAL